MNFPTTTPRRRHLDHPSVQTRAQTHTHTHTYISAPPHHPQLRLQAVPVQAPLRPNAPAHIVTAEPGPAARRTSRSGQNKRSGRRFFTSLLGLRTRPAAPPQPQPPHPTMQDPNDALWGSVDDAAAGRARPKPRTRLRFRRFMNALFPNQASAPAAPAISAPLNLTPDQGQHRPPAAGPGTVARPGNGTQEGRRGRMQPFPVPAAAQPPPPPPPAPAPAPAAEIGARRANTANATYVPSGGTRPDSILINYHLVELPDPEDGDPDLPTYSVPHLPVAGRVEIALTDIDRLHAAIPKFLEETERGPGGKTRTPFGRVCLMCINNEIAVESFVARCDNGPQTETDTEALKWYFSSCLPRVTTAELVAALNFSPDRMEDSLYRKVAFAACKLVFCLAVLRSGDRDRFLLDLRMYPYMSCRHAWLLEDAAKLADESFRCHRTVEIAKALKQAASVWCQYP